MALNEQQFYDLWEKFTVSDILEELPDDVEDECSRLGITVDYYIHEWL